MANRRRTVRIVDGRGNPCRGAAVTLSMGGEIIGTVANSTGRVVITAPAEAAIDVEAAYQHATRSATLAAGATSAEIVFPGIPLPRETLAERSAQYLLRKPAVRALAAEVAGTLARGLGRLPSLGLGLAAPPIEIRLPEPPLARCPDGTSGRPCVKCRLRNLTIRVCV